MAEITVRADVRETTLDPQDSIELSYEVRNTSQADVWVVRDHGTPFKVSDTEMRIVFGHVESKTGLARRLFRAPKMQKLAPAQVLADQVVIPMPFDEGVIDSSGAYQRKPVVLSGTVEITMEIGYGLAEYDEDVTSFDRYMKWQRLARSNAVTLQIRSP